jgi:alkaline phosphatase D
MLKRLVIVPVILLLGVFLSFGQSKKKPYVVLISFDGFRNDYVDSFKLENFRTFITEGASSEGIIPSFPSKTFPNHYSLVTGLYPGNHGLVDNYFYDPVRKSHYGMRNKEAVTDPFYYGGTPLWKLCYEQGLRSASYFWIGSELKQEGMHPDYFLPYDQSVPFHKRTDQVIEWLKLPEDKRPQFVSLYFSSPDYESHAFGPFARETRAKVLELDSLLGSFMRQLDELRLSVDVILVSDHGMKTLIHTRETYVFLDELPISKKNTVIVNGGTQVHIYTDSEDKRDSLFMKLAPLQQRFNVVKREDFPERWHYDNPRSGDLLLIAHPGYYFISGSPEKTLADKQEGASFGVHGYDAGKVRDMFGIFYAKGPHIKTTKIPAFENIHVFPLIARVLGLTAPSVDGKIEILEPILKK